MDVEQPAATEPITQGGMNPAEKLEARRLRRQEISRVSSKKLYDRKRAELAAVQLLKQLKKRGHRPSLSSVDRYRLFWDTDKSEWAIPEAVWVQLREADEARPPGEVRTARPGPGGALREGAGDLSLPPPGT